MSHDPTPDDTAAMIRSYLPGDTDMFQFLFDHIIGLADQLQRLKAQLDAQGLHVPPDLGQCVPPADEAVSLRVLDESARILASRQAPEGGDGATS